MQAYSFLGQSTGVLGHNNINIGPWDENNREGFDGQLSELTVRGREFLWIREGLSNPIDARILSSDYKSRIERERVEKLGDQGERGGERERWRRQRAIEETFFRGNK